MRKLFAGLLVGTLAVAGQMTVFAATGEMQQLTQAPVMQLAKINSAQEIALDNEAMMAISTIEAISIEDMTPEQKAEMERAQQEFEKRFKEACEKAKYDYASIKEKFEQGTLTEEEQKVLNEAGIMMAVAVESVAAICIEDMTPEQRAQMEEAQQEFENEIKEVCEQVGYDFETMMEHLDKGELTEEEKEILTEAGIIMADVVTAIDMETIELVETVEAVETVPATQAVKMTKIETAVEK